MSKSSNHKTLDLIEKGLKRLQKALSLVERMKNSDPCYKDRAKIMTDIKRKILQCRKLKWYKDRRIKSDFYAQALAEMKKVAGNGGHGGE